MQGCSNEYCASSGRKQTSKDDAAALALQLFMKKARLCEPLQEKNHKGTYILVQQITHCAVLCSCMCDFPIKSHCRLYFLHVICLCKHIKQGKNQFKEDIYVIGYSEETQRESMIVLRFPIMVIEITLVKTVWKIMAKALLRGHLFFQCYVYSLTGNSCFYRNSYNCPLNVNLTA